MSCLNFFFPLSHLFSLFLMWQCWNKISWNYFEIQTLWKDLSKTPVQSKACCVFYLLVWYGVQIMFGWHFMFGWSWLRFPFNFLIFRLFLFPLGFPHGRNIISVVQHEVTVHIFELLDRLYSIQPDKESEWWLYVLLELISIQIALLSASQSFSIQWNPVNTITNVPKNLAVLKGDHINKGYLQKHVWPSHKADKKSGHNNEVTVLLRWP